MVWQIELMATLPAGAAHNPLALVCKSELSRATWGGGGFENAIWMVPKRCMRGRNRQTVYLSQGTRHCRGAARPRSRLQVRVAIALRCRSLYVERDF